jgi:acetyl esterase/lipase
MWRVSGLCLVLWVGVAGAASGGGEVLAGHEGVRIWRDVAYVEEGGHERQRLDLLLPVRAKAARLPVVVFVHGGGWAGGDKAEGRAAMAKLVGGGEYAAVSVNYRLTDTAIWPAQVHDVKAAVRWVRGNARRLGLDGDRIGVAGASAGGHLALLLGMTGDDPELGGELGEHLEESDAVSCVVNFFGPANLVSVAKQPSVLLLGRPDSVLSKLLGGTVDEVREVAEEASPVSYIDADDPPVMTVHGNLDLVVSFEQAKELHGALRREGVESQLVTMALGGHGFRSGALEEAVGIFFDKWLLGREAEIKDLVLRPE